MTIHKINEEGETRQQKSYSEGKMKATWIDTETENVGHHNVTAGRRTIGGCFARSSFLS
jgi:hypothetical protein